jgi:hypothetical protein
VRLAVLGPDKYPINSGPLSRARVESLRVWARTSAFQRRLMGMRGPVWYLLRTQRKLGKLSAGEYARNDRLRSLWPVCPNGPPSIASSRVVVSSEEILTLGQALRLVQERKAERRRRPIFLVCGFQPLHLETFLKGHFALRFPNQAVDIQTGLYGDLEQTLAQVAGSQVEAAAVVIEWSDLDPRLELRSAEGWALSVQADIL